MRLWYASYGSNLRRDRLLCYLQGGRPAGATRTYPGARDRTPPQDDRALVLPGQVFFGWESATWGGGVAFYHPEAVGTTLARAYLVTQQQFSDIVAQEMHRDPGDEPDLDLGHVLEHRRHLLGPGRYDALHLVGRIGGEPVLTFTAPEPDRMHRNAPSEAYLVMVAAGLVEAHGLTVPEAVDYLLGCPGVRPTWSEEGLTGLLAAA